MDTECPYCSAKALEPMWGPDEVYFLEESTEDSAGLNITKWQAYRCDTCTRVCILDRNAI